MGPFHPVCLFGFLKAIEDGKEGISTVTEEIAALEKSTIGLSRVACSKDFLLAQRGQIAAYWTTKENRQNTIKICKLWSMGKMSEMVPKSFRICVSLLIGTFPTFWA